MLFLNDYKEKVDERDPTKPYREQKKAEPAQEPEKKEAKKIIIKKSVLPKGVIRKKSWTTTEIQFRGKHRVSESAPKARIYLVDRRPVFSSFTDD